MSLHTASLNIRDIARGLPDRLSADTAELLQVADKLCRINDLFRAFAARAADDDI